MNNLYQEAEELVFKKHPARYRLDIQSDRLNHKDTRLLQQHTEAIELMVDKMEKTATVNNDNNKEKKTLSVKEIHSKIPPNPVDQIVHHHHHH